MSKFYQRLSPEIIEQVADATVATGMRRERVDELMKIVIAAYDSAWQAFETEVVIHTEGDAALAVGTISIAAQLIAREADRLQAGVVSYMQLAGNASVTAVTLKGGK